MSAALSRKPKMSMFCRMWSGFTDFGIAMVPS